MVEENITPDQSQETPIDNQNPIAESIENAIDNANENAQSSAYLVQTGRSLNFHFRTN